ncbi:hypothetical protein FPV67DRAFT_1700508 [Lyophyllum atratum]|nr:hypothetical protein FPV67DRAFT_1700508 [Lyophyllum atratum]
MSSESIPGLYFEDGNVIICADAATVRVHRDVVGYHSAVFRRLWADHPISGQGVPILLLDDCAEDLVRYINGVYNINSGLGSPGPIPLAEVGSLLRMGRKYAHVGMFAAMADRVTVEYPAALSAWEYSRRKPFTRIEECVGFEFELLGMAYANDLYGSVPPLLYSICCKYTSEQLMAGLVRDDGTTVRIALRDQAICSIGRDRLAVAQDEHTFRWLRALPSTACTRPTLCDNFIASMTLASWGPIRKIRALEEWNEEWESALCSVCGEQAQEMHAAGRRRVWGELPLHFDMGNWEEICLLQEDLSNLVLDVDAEFL